MLNLSSSSVQKFPLFRQSGLPVLARASMNNHAKIYQNLKTGKHLTLTALTSGWGERILEMLSGASWNFDFTQRGKMPVLWTLTPFSALFRVVTGTVVSLSDRRTRGPWQVRFRAEWPVAVLFCWGLGAPWKQLLFSGKEVRSSWRLFLPISREAAPSRHARFRRSATGLITTYSGRVATAPPLTTHGLGQRWGALGTEIPPLSGDVVLRMIFTWSWCFGRGVRNPSSASLWNAQSELTIQLISFYFKKSDLQCFP